MEKGLCAALGDFDGVHLGHAAVIRSAVHHCAELTPAVYTFDRNCKNAPAITDNHTKTELLRSFGIKKIIFDSFDGIRELTPLQFVQNVLIEKYSIKTAVCGRDFRFGKSAMGDTALLKQLCDSHGITLITVDTLEQDGKKISSTDIRRCIEAGDMQGARRLLGHSYSVSGSVAHGKSLGHTKQTPTVNIHFGDNCVVPAYGVYITKTVIGGISFNSISNVGVRPSVETTDRPNIETNIFDFDSDIYDELITVEFLEMIRPEIKFDSIDALFEQIRKDICHAKQYFIGETND